MYGLKQRGSFSFSAGWLDNFKRQWNLLIFRSHGESYDANLRSVTEMLTTLRSIITKFCVEDIFDADECELNCRIRAMVMTPLLIKKFLKNMISHIENNKCARFT